MTVSPTGLIAPLGWTQGLGYYSNAITYFCVSYIHIKQALNRCFWSKFLLNFNVILNLSLI